MGISRPALNTVLNRLEDKRLIRRVRKPDDRRAVFVEMSAEADELYKRKGKIERIPEPDRGKTRNGRR